jgi:hypothetical protein
MTFEELKNYCRDFGSAVKDVTRQAHAVAGDKLRVPRLIAEIERLKAEIADLKALRLAMQDAESEASKSALRLYWENCALATYRDHANGILLDWVPKSEHNAVLQRYEKLKLDFASVSASKKLMEQEWGEFMNNYKVF